MGSIEADGQGNLPAVHVQQERLLPWFRPLLRPEPLSCFDPQPSFEPLPFFDSGPCFKQRLLVAVQVRLEASLFRAVRVDSEGGEPGRPVRLPKRRADDGGDAGPAADLPDGVQTRIPGRHPLAPVRLAPAQLAPARVVAAAEQPQVVPREGELGKHHQPGTVRVGVLDEAHMLRHIRVNAAVQGRVLDGGYGQRSGHEPILGGVCPRAVPLYGQLPQRFGP